MLILLSAGINSPIGAQSTDFASGTGTEEDPFIITTAEELANVNNYTTIEHSDKHFFLANDIDLDIAPYNSGAGWDPIGSELDEFYGSFNGGGNTISGLFIDANAVDYQGLFAFIAEDASVQNLNLTGVDITISSAPAEAIVGAIAGRNEGNLTRVYASGNIVGGGNNVGGLVGVNWTTALIRESGSSVSVSGTSYVGGVVGDNSGGTIREVYYTAGVIDCSGVGAGGIAGLSSGAAIDDVYARGANNCLNLAGGIIGYHTAAGTLITSYSTMTVNDSGADIGGLVGESDGGSTSVNSYWDTETSRISTSADGGSGELTVDMLVESTYSGFDFADVWEIVPSENDGYPILSWQEDPLDYTLIFSADKNGSLTGDSYQLVAPGANGTTVTAVPATGYQFAGWSDGVTTAARTDTGVSGNIIATANFEVAELSVNYSAVNGSITGVASQTVLYGASATSVTATPAAGYQFVRWSDGLTTTTRTDTNITADLAVTAIMELIPMPEPIDETSPVTEPLLTQQSQLPVTPPSLQPQFTPLIRPTDAQSTVVGNESNATTVDSIQVRFVDLSGNPIAGLAVNLVGSDQTAVTDENGVATFTDVPVGLNSLSVQGSETVANYEITAEADTNEVITIEFEDTFTSTQTSDTFDDESSDENQEPNGSANIWIILLILGVGGLILVSILRSRRKTEEYTFKE